MMVGMARTRSATSRVGRPPVTSRAQILEAAKALIERDGWEKLSLRRLAAEAGVGPTTVYYHVRDREDLLIHLLNDRVDETLTVELPDDPRERIVAAAQAMHDALVAWPWAAEILAADGFIGRLGPSALRLIETILAGAVESGCTPDQAAGIFRSIWYYTVGEILVRSRSARPEAEAARASIRGSMFKGVDLSGMPQLAAIGERWPTLAAQDTYREHLGPLVDGLLANARRS